MGKVWKITKTVFWTAIIVASVFIIITSLNLFGYQAFIVKSGSMEPKIKTGSVVIDHKSGDYKVGDVITYKTDGNNTVTHRLNKVETFNNQTVYISKGDANDAPDPTQINPANVVGKVWFSVPYIGYLMAFIRTLPGLIIFILIPAIIIVAEELSNIKTEVARLREAKKRVVEEVEKIEDALIDEEEKIKKKIKSPKKEVKDVE